MSCPEENQPIGSSPISILQSPDRQRSSPLQKPTTLKESVTSAIKRKLPPTPEDIICKDMSSSDNDADCEQPKSFLRPPPSILPSERGRTIKRARTAPRKRPEPQARTSENLGMISIFSYSPTIQTMPSVHNFIPLLQSNSSPPTFMDVMNDQDQEHEDVLIFFNNKQSKLRALFRN